jgi:hypothetical protein
MTPIRWFGIGDGVLALDSTDVPLRERFETIYGECAMDGPSDVPTLRCEVRTSGPHVTVSFDDPEPLLVHQFIEAVFPGRTCHFDASADGRVVRVPATSEWRPLVANLAVSRVQRLQTHVMFFHAASLAVSNRGVIACGPKRAGKTTLSMSLACRGHALFGDEVAAVRLASRELLPVRRSLAVRTGPASPSAQAALMAIDPEIEIFPDGERRARAAVGRLFEAPPATAPLTTVLLLRSMASAPVAEVAAVRPALLAQVTPLAASLWGRSTGAVTIQLMRLLSACGIYWIDAGPPDETAALVERLVETS